MKNKSFLSIADLSKEEMVALFVAAAKIKKKTAVGKFRSDLAGKKLPSPGLIHPAMASHCPCRKARSPCFPAWV